MSGHVRAGRGTGHRSLRSGCLATNALGAELGIATKLGRADGP